MAKTDPFTFDVAAETLKIYLAHGRNQVHAADALGISRGGLQNRLRTMKRRFGLSPDNPSPRRSPDFERPELPPELRPVEELVEERKRKYGQLNAAKEARKLIPIQVKIAGPIGILHFGDPHLDDNGTDMVAIEHHTDLVRRTEGMFGANIGDTTNNWTGRLARLYAEQSTSAQEALQLAEWFLDRVPWLYVLGGNHDVWTNPGSPLKWILRHCAGVHQDHAARLALQFSTGREVRINARHDFRGYSQWNTAHAVAKAAQMTRSDHIYIAGHKHISGYNVLKCPTTGLLSHAIQVASYKVWDEYGERLGLPDQAISPCAVTIIDPAATSEVNFVTVFFDADEGADYLTWKRRRK